ILDEDLPWTTGEALSLALLFRYLKVWYELPSDTMVRNQLAKIFAELHGKVVREFSVSVDLKRVMRLMNVLRESNRKSHSLKILGLQSKWFTHFCVPLGFSLTRNETWLSRLLTSSLLMIRSIRVSIRAMPLLKAYGNVVHYTR
ncbi:hypothetical protein C8R42DRAFT_593447, partial [Lentinula raphanica]